MTLKFIIFVLYLKFFTLCECRNLTIEEQRMEKNILPTWKFIKQVIADTSNTKTNYQVNLNEGRMFAPISKNRNFFCETSGFRSLEPPDSVNKLRPGDIDVIAAMGDSVTSGNGIIAEHMYHSLVENRGISWSIGGRGTWRTFWTLPNFLKEFNPNLYGYATADGISVKKQSRFNVAEPMTISPDMLFQAKVLLQRMRNDKNVNMTTDWKLLTIFIGTNDFCQQICELENPDDLLELHKQDMIKTLRFLRENFPRLFINWVPAVNVVKNSRNMTNLPIWCRVTQMVECDCIFRPYLRPNQYNLYESINKKWQKLDKEIVNLKEFHTKDFTVNYQPFSINASVKKRNGKTDYRFLSVDCFHFSHLGHAAMANALWNNMFQPDNKKQLELYNNFKKFECPTKEHPFLLTRENS